MTDKDNVKKQYENYKKQLDKINDRYSETYVKPETDMPDSLGLKTVDYKMPSEDELRKKAETALEADRQSAISKIGKETEEKIKKQSALKDQAFAEAAKRLLDIDSEREQAVREVKNDALARNIARSSIASEGVRETEERVDALRRDAQAERDGTAEAIDREIEALKKQASDSLSQTEKNFLSRLEAETEKLREKALEEKTEAEKYNNTVAEKEAEYEKALEERREELERREWERLARLAEIKNRQGESALKSMKQKEILSATKEFFDGLSPADALSLFLSDTGMQSVLGEDYVWFLNYLQTRKNG